MKKMLIAMTMILMTLTAGCSWLDGLASLFSVFDIKGLGWF